MSEQNPNTQPFTHPSQQGSGPAGGPVLPPAGQPFQQQPPMPPVQTKIKKRHPIRNGVIIGVVAFAVGCGIGASGDANTTTASPGASVTVTEKAKPGGTKTVTVPGPTTTVTAQPEPGADGDGGGDPQPEDNQPADTGDMTAKVGQTFTYENGLKVIVTKIEHQTPTNMYDDRSGDGKVMVVYVKITNGTDAGFKGSLGQVQVLYGPDGEEAEQALNVGMDYVFTDLPKGQTKTYKMAFILQKKNAKNLFVNVTPGMEYETLAVTR